MRYYFINLDTATSRREKIIKEFEEHHVAYRRVNAINSEHNNKCSREAACHRSHMKAIQDFVENSDDDYGIICEDDLVFDYKEYWKYAPDELLDHAPNDVGAVQLCVIYTPISKPDNPWHKQEEFFPWGTINSVGSCLAYIIKRDCAKQLLTYFETGNRKFPPADSINGIYGNINRYTDYIAYTYKYPLFTYRDDNDTQLDNCLNNQIASKKRVTDFLKKSKSKNWM